MKTTAQPFTLDVKRFKTVNTLTSLRLLLGGASVPSPLSRSLQFSNPRFWCEDYEMTIAAPSDGVIKLLKAFDERRNLKNGPPPQPKCVVLLMIIIARLRGQSATPKDIWREYF